MTKRNISVAKKTPKSNKAVKITVPTPPGTRTAFVPTASSRYAGLKGTALGAFTLASMIVSGIAKLAAKSSEMTAGDDPSMALFRAMVGPTAFRYHAKKFAKGALTAEGLAFFNARLVGQAPTFNTDPETVRAMAQAATKGGTVEIGGQAVVFDQKINVTVA